MITLDSVSKSYAKGQPAVNNVSLHIEKGEFVFIVGNSGSGKSTLIKLLLKELEPTSGTIKVNGQILNKMKRWRVPKYRRGVGVVFQDFRLLKDRNVYENVAFAQRVIEKPNRVIKKRVPEIRSVVSSKNSEKTGFLESALSGGTVIALCTEPFLFSESFRAGSGAVSSGAPAIVCTLGGCCKAVSFSG